MKQELIYSTKVWLTTVVLGMRIAALIKILIDTDHLIYSPIDIIDSAIYDIPIGFFMCLPSWIIFAGITKYLNKSSIGLIPQKSVLSVSAIFLGVLPFAIFSWHQLTHINYLPDMLPELIGYVAITIVGIWIYKIKSTSKSMPIQVS